MTPGDFKARLRGTSEQTFEPAPDAPEDVDEPESTRETNFQAGDEHETEPEVEESVEDPEAVEEDLAWLQELKDYKELHGLPVKDVLQALAEGRLPEEFHDLIKIKLKNGDQEWESPLSKARKEAMLHHDYTNKLQAFARERDEYHADKNEFIEMLQSWKTNPEALLSGLERLDFPMLDAAKLLAKRHKELQDMTPRERELYEAKQQLERELNKNKYEAKRQEKAQAEARSKADGDKMADFVSNTAHTLFAKNQIPVEPKTWNMFLQKFQIVAGSYPTGTQWTADMVEAAVEAAAHDYREAYGRRAQAQEQAKQQPAKKPLAKPEFSSPAREQVTKLQQAAPQQRVGKKGGAMSAADFRKTFLGRR